MPKAAWFKGYQSIPPRNDGALMEALWRHGPLAVSICASGKLFKFYGQGVYDDPTCGSSLVSALNGELLPLPAGVCFARDGAAPVCLAAELLGCQRH